MVFLLAAGCCESTLLVCTLTHWGPGYENGLWDLLCDERHTNERSHCQPAREDGQFLTMAVKPKLNSAAGVLRSSKKNYLGIVYRAKLICSMYWAYS